MTTNKLKKHKTKRYWATLLLLVGGGISLILGLALGITYSKFGQDQNLFNTATNLTNKDRALQFIVQSDIDCNAFVPSLSENGTTTYTNTPYTVKDYVYFPSFDDVNDNGNYGFINRYTRVCAPTDWVIANYAVLSTTFATPEHVPMESSVTTNSISGGWWCRSKAQPHILGYVESRGYVAHGGGNTDNKPSRCALHLNLQAVISALKAGDATRGTATAYEEANGKSPTTFNTITLKNLMYPQTIATSDMQKTLEDAYNDGNLLSTIKATGREYMGRATIETTGDNIGNLTSTYNTVKEYKYNGEYYVRTPQYSWYTGLDYKYSDGNFAKSDGTPIWIKVEPITWVIPPSQWEAYGYNLTNQTSITGSMEVFSLYVIVSGMYYYPNTDDIYSTSWAGSIWRAYLNGYDLSKDQGDGGDSYKASIKTNFANDYSFINTIYHDLREEVEKPTLSSTNFALSGSSFSIADKFINFDSTKVDISGDITVSAIGTYTTTISLKNTEDNVWSDGTDTSVTYTWTLLDTLTKPTLKDVNLIYNGSAITITDSAYCLNFDSSTMTALGNVTKTDAGNYEVVFALKDSSLHYWEDGTNAPFSLSWSIKRKVFNNPSFNNGGELTFSGTTQRILNNLTGFDTNFMTCSGMMSAKRAGTYYIFVCLKDTDNYRFSNGQTFAVLTWTITPYTLTDENTSITTGTN